MCDFDNFVNDLIENDDIEQQPNKSNTSVKKFPCGQCAGTGFYRGVRVHQEKSHCFACKGKGYFKTDPRKLKAAKIARQKKKEDARNAARDANMAIDDGQFFKSLMDIREWNTFAADLCVKHAQGKLWSGAQVAAAKNMLDKIAATRAKKAAEREANAVTVDLQPIIDMFNSALESGYKKPMFRAEGIRIKPGKGGALYVMTEQRMEFGMYGEQPGYEGKILDGKFMPVRRAEPTTAPALLKIAENPLEAALRYGQKTGRCACCGRELTNHTSVEAGIGPICRDKWGL